MRTSFFALAIVAASCGGSPKPAPTPPANSGKSRIDCPAEPALTALARAQWNASEGDIGVECVALYHGGPRWLLDGYHAPADADGIAFVQTLVDAQTGQAVWTTGAGEFDFPPGAIDRESANQWSPVDLDADGNDEVIHISGTMAQGYDMQNLEVLAIDAHGLRLAGSIAYAEDNSAADEDPAQQVSCSSTWKLVAGEQGTKQLELTATSSGAVAGGCLTPGTHVLRWTGQELIESK